MWQSQNLNYGGLDSVSTVLKQYTLYCFCYREMATDTQALCLGDIRK